MKLRKIIFLAIMISISIVLSIVESMISITIFIIPGVKLGLANIITLVVLYIYGGKEAFVVSIFRIFIVSLIYSGLFTPTSMMSLAGGIIAYLTMVAIKQIPKLSIVSVSVMGALMHMVGQIGMAIIVLDTPTLIYYLPYMILISIPTGLLTGLVGRKMTDIFHNQLNNPERE
jgi:heptaprenyl diphosphate synthase